MTSPSADNAKPDGGEDYWLTPHMLADRWAVSRSFLHNMRDNGDGPKWSRIGRHLVRYRITDVEAYEQRTRRDGSRRSA